MIDSNIGELFSWDGSPAVVSYMEEQPIIGIEVYLLRQLTNPFRVAWTLIKLGYEPLAPVQFHSPLALLGFSSPVYVYPNFLRFFANATHDFTIEIFRAAFKRRTMIWMRSENKLAYKRPRIRGVQHQALKGFQAERLLEESRLSVFFERFSEVVLLKIWEVLFSHPFYVITIRQIAALIGNETQYKWFPMAIQAIYRENGILGFFQGFVPRLIGEIILTSAYYCCCRLVRSLIFGLGRHSAENMSILRVLLYYTLHNYTYPFELTGCVMAVHGAKLVGAAEANSFHNWYECKCYLGLNNQMIRGWRPFLRSHVQKIHLPEKQLENPSYLYLDQLNTT
ncbi:unnamed protein product [Heterobilharzia americana]|nr:unnamed protein product [Heterobilharzia americana]